MARQRVSCSNCGMIYERPQVMLCPACKSNAADPVPGSDATVRGHHESAIPAGPRGPKELTDDLPAWGKWPLGGGLRPRNLED